MWSIISFVITIVLGGIFLFLAEVVDGITDDSKASATLYGIFVLLTMFLWIYGFGGLLCFAISDNKNDEHKRYIKAESYCEILKSDVELPLDVVNEFKYNIEYMNTLIDKSRKRYNHPYYGSFYYKETADLKKLNYDTINVKIKL